MNRITGYVIAVALASASTAMAQTGENTDAASTTPAPPGTRALDGLALGSDMTAVENFLRSKGCMTHTREVEWGGGNVQGRTERFLSCALAGEGYAVDMLPEVAGGRAFSIIHRFDSKQALSDIADQVAQEQKLPKILSLANVSQTEWAYADLFVGISSDTHTKEFQDDRNYTYEIVVRGTGKQRAIEQAIRDAGKR